MKSASSTVGMTGTQRGMTCAQKMMAKILLTTLAKHGASEVHHGDCIGADADFNEIAFKLGIPIVLHPPADSSKRAFCKRGVVRVELERPYIQRNHRIVDSSDTMLIFPGEHREQLRSGTWATSRFAKKRKVTRIIVYPDGTIARPPIT